jgi:AbrB family looped-hinge helix DNA binding protein
MTHRVGPKGQVVIPKDLRDELGIKPGDEVSFWRHGDHVAVRPASRRRPLRGRFEGSSLVDVLAAEREADRRREAGP